MAGSEPTPAPKEMPPVCVAPGKDAVATALNFPAGFLDAGEIDAYFQKCRGAEFVDWFNHAIAGKDAWITEQGEKIRIVDPPGSTAKAEFKRLWTAEHVQRIFGLEPGERMSLVQFVALMSAILNESPGLVPIEEDTNPGGEFGNLGYAFKLYNQRPGLMHTALALFRDPDFLDEHGSKPGAEAARPPSDAWGGSNWKATGVGYRADPAKRLFVMEADFYKFRGRGLIQTTHRANYRYLIAFVLDHAGGPPALIGATAKAWDEDGCWAEVKKAEAAADGAKAKKKAKVERQRLLDEIATRSSGEQWNDLFTKTDLFVAVEAIRLHSEHAGNYLGKLSARSGPRLLTALYNMGLKIRGGKAAAELFRKRVRQVLSAIAKPPKK